MNTYDEIMQERRRMLMSLLQDKRCKTVHTALGTALNQVTNWLRTGSREDYSAFNAVYDEACTAVDSALELSSIPFQIAAQKLYVGRPKWLEDLLGNGTQE